MSMADSGAEQGVSNASALKMTLQGPAQGHRRHPCLCARGASGEKGTTLSIVPWFSALQKQEHVRFEQILGERISEFKKSGGSLQELSNALSGMGSLMLPRIPDYCGGDEATSSVGSGSH